MTTLIDLQEVRKYAISAHAAVVNEDGTHGQLRKYSNEPYISHPLAVAGIVATTPGATVEMIASAVLHDVVEDTAKDRGLTRQQAINDIRVRFGEGVASNVDWLSDITTHEDGDRKTRKLIERERLARAPDCVQTIKVADVLHNIMSIVTHDLKFSFIYLPEKKAVLDELTRADPHLLAWAHTLLASSWDTLKNRVPVDEIKSIKDRP